ncbi:nitrate ABC transporter permease [Synechococcus sp. Cruz-9H2]|uniref:nitrate ABC transporter permease n=1 Tax=unclassified Synechococcus TaxID=2626047 RepID=UPI0020CE2E34|nr:MULTISPECIES: nitrate ABC transporter permease [unclassified Synechococcus]MCP9820056.1 nitrate ABC transporter permease [Synechococcus sp. Cruz-9H2]MCP9844362.1 nitrate ABC transporter permease [Synechococcus sp. Edmonson 11F2]MCP9856486.1 nitrate ABC transporter permease [Synechococcus sp. Cruz-9C9]MCP9863739.1 nitrate ABC transporter permease [Synechococcus sp. Cruz-7E5]MCP9870966.1 nitrate ABC transporter permease [Synechococcus sp. Cruz-7B9]
MTLTAPLDRRRPRPFSSAILKAVVPYVICIGAFLISWQLLSGILGAARLPGPIQVVADTWDPYISDPFFDDGGTSKGLGWQILISLQRVAIGYGLSGIVGIAIGGLLGLNRFIGKGFDPVIQVLRTVPPLAWFPIALMVFQDANTSAVFVIFITSIWPVIINTAVGIRQIPQDYTNVARVLRLRKRSYIREIVIPATVPYVFTGLRIAVGLAWLAIVAAEMLKADGGIGYFIWDAYNAGGDTSASQIILAIVYVGIVGLALDRLVAFAGSKVSGGH